jgi:hypothetical protein
MELEVLVRYKRSSEGACAQQVCFGSTVMFSHRRSITSMAAPRTHIITQ